MPEGPFLVVGLARAGAAVAEMLAGRGARVVGVDRKSPAEAGRLEGVGVEVLTDVPDDEQVARLDGVTTVVKSPGVPREARVIAAARERGIDIVGELEVAWRALPNRFLAVTGTNGKTTTVELLGHIFRTAGEPVVVAGNVGTPLASLVGEVDPEATIVCECSSFQLEDSVAFAPECAVLLNITPDHLDRHSYDDYVAAKLKIFANQEAADVAVYPPSVVDDVPGQGRHVTFESASEFVDPHDMRLPGAHNAGNAMAAAAAALAMGVDPEAVREGVRSFKGIPHRLEVVDERDGVLYVNDSKATNVAAAVAGIRSFERPVHAILGGSLKGDTFEGLVDPVRERCKAAYLIGEAAEQLDRDLEASAVPRNRFGSLEEAVHAAAAAAVHGEVVLLSPACASFDAFADYAERGDRFREVVGRGPSTPPGIQPGSAQDDE
jgi:UDP-N-acetylmuramoylalanine--D-glutamate ligase